MLGPEARSQFPELATTTLAENLNIPQPQMLGPDARQQLPELDFTRHADELVELPVIFSRQEFSLQNEP